MFADDPFGTEGEAVELVFRIGDEFEYYFASEDPDNIDGVTDDRSVLYDFFSSGGEPFTSFFVNGSVDDPNRNNDPNASLNIAIDFLEEFITEYTAQRACG